MGVAFEHTYRLGVLPAAHDSFRLLGYSIVSSAEAMGVDARFGVHHVPAANIRGVCAGGRHVARLDQP